MRGEIPLIDLGQAKATHLDGPLSVLLVNLRAEDYPVRSAPTALMTLGAVAKRHCNHPLLLQYFDRQIDDVDALIRRIEQDQPAVVGISAQFGTLGDLRQVLSRLEEFGQRPMVVVGNVSATYACEAILAAHPWVVCCVGRGEETWTNLLQNVAQGGSWLGPAEVPNLVFTGAGGRLIRTTAKAAPAELVCPGDWDGFFPPIPTSGTVRCGWRLVT